MVLVDVNLFGRVVRGMVASSVLDARGDWIADAYLEGVLVQTGTATFFATVSQITIVR